MSRKWYTLGLLVFAAACGDVEDDTMDMDGFETEEQTAPAPPTTDMDTTDMMQDTMMMEDTLGVDDDVEDDDPMGT